MPTIVGILTFISMIVQHLRDLNQEASLFVGILVLKSNWKLCSAELSIKKVL